MKNKNLIELAKKYLYFELAKLVKLRKKITDKEKVKLFSQIIANIKNGSIINNTKGK